MGLNSSLITQSLQSRDATVFPRNVRGLMSAGGASLFALDCKPHWISLPPLGWKGQHLQQHKFRRRSSLVRTESPVWCVEAASPPAAPFRLVWATAGFLKWDGQTAEAFLRSGYRNHERLIYFLVFIGWVFMQLRSHKKSSPGGGGYGKALGITLPAPRHLSKGMIGKMNIIYLSLEKSRWTWIIFLWLDLNIHGWVNPNLPQDILDLFFWGHLYEK